MNYELSEHYEIKIPNIADLSTINSWGEIINDAMQKIDDTLAATDVELGSTDTVVGQVGDAKDTISSDEDGVEALEILLVADLETIEAKSPVTTETQATLEADISEMETKLYTTIPTLKAAATGTGGFSGTAEFLKSSNRDLLYFSAGALYHISLNQPG